MMLREDSSPLGDRTQQILRLLIRTYITSGEPVGSGTLSRNIEGKLSPATIRNIMAELEDAGYLTHMWTVFRIRARSANLRSV
jgi:heat-inducible transcriptional repressor